MGYIIIMKQSDLTILSPQCTINDESNARMLWLDGWVGGRWINHAFILHFVRTTLFLKTKKVTDNFSLLNVNIEIDHGG